MSKFLFLVFLFPSFIFAECFNPETGNYMAQEWNAVNSTDTVELTNHWFYTASGTENLNFAFGSDDNFFEVKLLSNRFLLPRIETREGGLFVYGPNYNGQQTLMVRVLCPGAPQSAAQIDPWKGYCGCNDKHYFYQVVGSETYLHLKAGKMPIKEIK